MNFLNLMILKKREEGTTKGTKFTPPYAIIIMGLKKKNVRRNFDNC